MTNTKEFLYLFPGIVERLIKKTSFLISTYEKMEEILFISSIFYLTR